MSSYLIYRGAMYRKAGVLDEQLLRTAWKALRPKAARFSSYFQTKVIDAIIQMANDRLEEETRKFSAAVSKELFDDLIKELQAGTGGVDIASKKKVRKMARALVDAIVTGKINQSVLSLLLGWTPPEIEEVRYRNMAHYFDPDRPEGAAYLKEVVTRLDPLL
jgi:hypothetical protein